MARVITSPPKLPLLADGAKVGGWWHDTEDSGRIACDLCPRACQLKPGDRGFCFVRENRDGRMVLATYGRSTGFCIDPIEKKPLNHFHPGTSVLSFGTAGCNLGCKFCQNWDISKSREVARLSEVASPETIAAAAKHLGCKSVAYTYNDPVIWAEYAIDVAEACRAVGVKSVAVTAGYIMPQAREAFFRQMDAANVDLKAFTEEFYYKLTYSHLQPVLDTLRWLKQETDVWFEITNLVIPDENDSADELRRMCDWVLESVGDEVPLHFSAFHPDFRMRDKPRTPPATLLAARKIAIEQGVKFAYVGNVDDVTNQSTYCPACGDLLIERNWYELGVYAMRQDQCGKCGARIAGRFESEPGDWGQKRMPVRVSQFARGQAERPTQRTEGNVMAKDKTEQNAAPESQAPVSPELTKAQEAAIHRAACEIVAAGVHGRQPKLSDPALDGAARQAVMGAFVTLKRQGKLRACCGTLGRTFPLVEAVQHASLRTATEDTRFPTISPTELPHLDVDVTLLYGFQPFTSLGEERVKEVEVGRHGLHIQRGTQSGLLLPSVPVEWGWDAEEFLQHVCRKAGLPTTAWTADDTRLQKFEGHIVSGPFFADILAGPAGEPPARFSPQDLAALAEQCRNNIVALVRGATPNYYLIGCPDGDVEVVSLSLEHSPGQAPVVYSQTSLRPGLPLQATLFKLAEAAANSLKQARAGEAVLGRIKVGLTLLYDPAMHGTVEQPAVDGIDMSRRCVMVVEHGKSAWIFDPGQTAQQALDAAAADAQVRTPEAASVFSLAAASTEPRATLSNVPRPQQGSSVRPMAVSGMFYPADESELSKLLDGFLENGSTKPAPWPAVMVPHAGLIYSGRIAAQTLKRVQIPDTAIILCPKHTRMGVDWAVAPHDAWAVPGGTVAGDLELARHLANAIDGLELDAAAHQREHAIEVELPLFARLAPHCRIVGITVGAASLAACQQFATGLAAALEGLDEAPLLVISTDMNHYASDQENRRLDAIALDAVESLDPAKVYETVVNRHNISMCGVRPAVIVMETLRQLGQLRRCERVVYGTSGDTSGDKSRVVGYAGMLLGCPECCFGL